MAQSLEADSDANFAEAPSNPLLEERKDYPIESPISQYLCSLRQKRNISSLQTILKQEKEYIRDFTRRFRQAIQQIE